jgi:hypothetical protein
MIKEPTTFPNTYIKIIILSFFLAHPLNAYTDENHNGTSITVSAGDSVIRISAFNLKRGELLFYGLVPIDKSLPACVDCHITNYIDTLNWNPSAYDIAGAFTGKQVEELMSVINAPFGKKISEAHRGFHISRQQAMLLQAYLEKLNIEGSPLKKPLINHLILFILVNIIGIFFTIDLIFTRMIPYRIIHLLIITISALYITKVLVVESIAIGRSQNYEPVQPIKFSHAVHAGQNQIACEYCHSTAETSKTAGIPSVNICMNCHVLVREGTRSGKFEINKILQAYGNKQPIEWIKVHNLPDYVFFSHAQHVGAGKIACETCHGDVKSMDHIIQVKDLSMGWCVNCHRTTKVQFTENTFYGQYEELHKKLMEGKIDGVTVADVGGIDCMKCHY